MPETTSTITELSESSKKPQSAVKARIPAAVPESRPASQVHLTTS